MWREDFVASKTVKNRIEIRITKVLNCCGGMQTERN